jgi:uncharacterized protein YbjT (DUF2867 family)
VASVVVTGGTGTLGRVLVPRLLSAGHEVRVLSRQPSPALPPGAGAVRGDVRTGTGLVEALEGADVVVHAASSPMRHAHETEVEGSRRVAAEASRHGAHLVYVSIVGVDRHRYPYYRAKREAEQVLQASGADVTILRATQFHDLLDYFLSRRVFVRTPNLAFQVVDAGDVADRLVEIVAAPPTGRAPDFGGPEVLSIGDLAAARARATGSRTGLVRVPRVGFMADFDAGLHLCPDHRAGRIGWERWLQTRGRRRSAG